jgi:competence protein ComEA
MERSSRLGRRMEAQLQEPRKGIPMHSDRGIREERSGRRDFGGGAAARLERRRFGGAWLLLLAVVVAAAIGVTSRSARADERVDLNHATAAELAGLPGIGEAKARAIVSHRETTPFKSVDDLVQVKGIGERMLEQLRDKVTVSGAEDGSGGASRGAAARAGAAHSAAGDGAKPAAAKPAGS